MRIFIVITLLSVVANPGSALSQSTEEKEGQALCYQIEAMLNALVDYTHTACIPAAGDTAGTISLILVSSEPVFSVEASKKGWVLGAVAAVGYALNKDVSVKSGSLWLSDVNQMKSRTAFVMPAPLAKSLQHRVKGNQITLDGMYSEIIKNLSKQSIPKR